MKRCCISINDKLAEFIYDMNTNFSKYIEYCIIRDINSDFNFSDFKKDIWTRKELDYLKEFYCIRTRNELSLMLSRTSRAVKSKLSDLGLRLTSTQRGNIRRRTGSKPKMSYIKCGHCSDRILRHDWDIKRLKNCFCSKECRCKYQSINFSGKNNPRYKGKWKTSDGYINVYIPTHQNSDKAGYVKEHRLVVEKKLKRLLTKVEVVHHIDCNRQNNNINNLMLFPSSSTHIKFHTKIRQHGMTNPISRQILNRWKEYENSEANI